VPLSELLDLRRQVLESTATDPYTRWARWFFADRSTRPRSLENAGTLTDEIRMLVERNTENSLRRALYYSPTHCEAYARLALVLRSQNTRSNAVIAAEADWCEHKARESRSR
jgi:hypothetical protein